MRRACHSTPPTSSSRRLTSSAAKQASKSTSGCIWTRRCRPEPGWAAAVATRRLRSGQRTGCAATWQVRRSFWSGRQTSGPTFPSSSRRALPTALAGGR
ncbi:hypothetical protein CLOM_g11260 [Closterium sp. NIES-68]|nr:hypothetical protein CLOM_g11260 [Closterium sp. NIES-68]